MTEKRLIPLKPSELLEAREVIKRRLPPGLNPGPLDLNKIVSICNSSDSQSTEAQAQRINRKRKKRAAMFPNLETKDKTQDELHEQIALILGNEFSISDVIKILSHFHVPAFTLWSHLRSSINAERQVEKGPTSDRRYGSQGRIIKWEWIQEGNRNFAFYQRSYKGWHWTGEKTWKQFPGPTFPLAHIDFLRFRFHEILLDFHLRVFVIPVPCFKEGTESTTGQ